MHGKDTFDETEKPNPVDCRASFLWLTAADYNEQAVAFYERVGPAAESGWYCTHLVVGRSTWDGVESRQPCAYRLNLDTLTTNHRWAGGAATI